MAAQTGPYDAQDGDDEQDGKGHVRADEGGGEDAATTWRAVEEAWTSGARTAAMGRVSAARTRAVRQSVQTWARA